MPSPALGGTFDLSSDLTVRRMGYGAMQLAGKGVFGPPADHDGAIAVLRAAVDAGVDHIDTSDFYGPHVTNLLIREALHPYPDHLTIVTKVGAKRDERGGWLDAQSPDELRAAVEDNLRNLGVDALDVVNFRLHSDGRDPSHIDHSSSVAEAFGTLAELQDQGLIRHLGLSTVGAAHIAEARSIAPVVCVQNYYNIANRADDDLIDVLASDGIAYVPYFPLGGFSQLQSETLSGVAARLDTTPMAVALAWLLARSPNILLIPGTSSVEHLGQNLAAADLTLGADDLAELDAI